MKITKLQNNIRKSLRNGLTQSSFKCPMMCYEPINPKVKKLQKLKKV